MSSLKNYNRITETQSVQFIKGKQQLEHWESNSIPEHSELWSEHAIPLTSYTYSAVYILF